MKLTAKQKLFCEEYLVDLNATQAAIRAGYSKKTARQMGDENMSKPVIKDYLAECQKERQERTKIDQDYVLNMIKETVEKCNTIEGFDPKNVLKGCDLLGKHLGLFTEIKNHKHSFMGADGKPIGLTVNINFVDPEEAKK